MSHYMLKYQVFSMGALFLASFHVPAVVIASIFYAIATSGAHKDSRNILKYSSELHSSSFVVFKTIMSN